MRPDMFIGIVDPTCRNPAAPHPGVVVWTVKSKLHLQAIAGRSLEHSTLQSLSAVPAGGRPMVGEREDDAREPGTVLLASSLPSTRAKYPPLDRP